MEILEIILIGVALSMDACAITIANCTAHKCELTRKRELAMPIFFAIFQGLMPLIGYLIGSLFAGYILAYTDYLTAGIFLFLAIKIVVDIFKEKNAEKCCALKAETPSLNSCEIKKKKSSFSVWIILIQAVATSIDALAVGVTFINLTLPVYAAILIIVGVTFLLVCAALLFGKTLGKLFGEYAEWIGAGILFILAIKSLIDALI